MKIVRFKAAGKVRYGVIEGSHVVEYSGTPYGGFRRATAIPLGRPLPDASRNLPG